MNRLFLLLISCMTLFILYLLILTLTPLFFVDSKDDYLPYNEILNIAVVVDQKEYILNLEQQKKMLTYLKRWEPLPFEKIIIYRFNGKETLCLNNF